MMSCSTSQSIACAERWHRILVLTHRSPGCRAVERVVGVTTGVTKLCASHGVCVRFRAARRHMRFCIRFTYVCAHVVFFIFEPSAVCSLTPSRSRVHRIRCSAWRPRSGPDSGPGCIRHPRRSALFCDSDCAVQARAHVANLPRATWRLASVSQIISHRGCYTRHAAVSDSPKLARGTTQSGVLTAELLAATRSAAEWSRRRGLHRWHVVSRNTGR